MSLDLKDFFLTTKKMLRPEFMRIPMKTIPAAIIAQYKLEEIAQNGFVYTRIDGGMYGLPHASRLASELLTPRLKEEGYNQSTDIQGLFRHKTRPVKFGLIVDDFGASYVGDENALHLLHILEKYYTVTTDWTGTQFCGLTLKWDYINRCVPTLNARLCRQSSPAIQTRSNQEKTRCTPPTCYPTVWSQSTAHNSRFI